MTGCARIRRVPRWLSVLTVLLVPLLNVACSSDPPPPDSFYDFDIAGPAQRFEDPILDGVLSVERFSAEGVLGERALLYRETGQTGVRQYNYHYWAGLPGLMLRDAVIETYRKANVASRIVSPELRLLPDYRLTGRLKTLRHRRDAATAAAVIAVEITVTRTRDGELLLLKTYEREREPSRDNVQAAVRAFQAALADILSKSTADLAANVSP